MDYDPPANGAGLPHAEPTQTRQGDRIASPTARNGTRVAGALPALPHDLEAEQAVLGALLLNNGALERATELLEPRHFFEPLHQRLFEKTSGLISKGRIASPLTLKIAMGDDPALAEVGGQAYLANLVGAAVAVVSPNDYARLVYDLAMRRELIRIADQVRETAYDGKVDLSPRDQIEQAEIQLFDLAEHGRHERGFQHIRPVLTKAIEMAESAYKRKAGVAGIGTGFKDLDELLGGLFPSDLVILAGRPGMGKTSLATNIAFNVAASYRVTKDDDGKDAVADGGAVAFFSLEMSEVQLALRILSEQSEVLPDKIRKGKINDDEVRRLVRASSELQDIPFYIDATGAIPLPALATRARRLKRTAGLDFIVVDYLQLVSAAGRRRYDNRVHEVSEISQGLKALAKELNVPILALSQLSRAVEHREDKRPVLADLRDSGSIEQDADIVMFIYRADYYPDSEKSGEDSLKKDTGGVAEILIEKHRHGPTGKVKLHFAPEFTRFDNLAHTRYERPGYDVR